jgi:hypothetical protein
MRHVISSFVLPCASLSQETIHEVEVFAMPVVCSRFSAKTAPSSSVVISTKATMSCETGATLLLFDRGKPPSGNHRYSTDGESCCNLTLPHLTRPSGGCLWNSKQTHYCRVDDGKTIGVPSCSSGPRHQADRVGSLQTAGRVSVGDQKTWPGGRMRNVAPLIHRSREE